MATRATCASWLLAERYVWNVKAYTTGNCGEIFPIYRCPAPAGEPYAYSLELPGGAAHLYFSKEEAGRECCQDGRGVVIPLYRHPAAVEAAQEESK